MSESILLVEDEVGFAETLLRVLRAAGYRVDLAQRVSEAVAMLAKGKYDTVLSDINLPDGNGLELLKELRLEDPLRPIVLMTGSASADMAVEATLSGAFDFLLKPIERAELLGIMEKALACRAMSKQTAILPHASEEDENREGFIVGSSPVMVRLFKEMGRVARQPAPVLLNGETGTGKELIARALYFYSGLRGKPFVPVNCAAIPENLIESELFGHEKGAFTGAQTRRIGRFQQADGGMIFLDEIGELPLAMQAKLLRVLQEREVQPLGSSQIIKVNVRVIAATHRNLKKEIEAGRFREDLYFRLGVARLVLPPLRERRDDIPELVGHFLRWKKGEGQSELTITSEALALLVKSEWPGNVRELENVVKRAAMMTTNGVIGLDHVETALGGDESESGEESTLGSDGGSLNALMDRHLTETSEGGEVRPLLQELERQMIELVLRKTDNNKTKAAQILGINRKTLREKLALYAIEAGDPADASADSH